MRMIAGLCATSLLLVAACQKAEDSPPPAEATPAGPVGVGVTTSVDPSGAAPPQPSPNGGDTPVGAAGVGGESPEARDAVQQGNSADPGGAALPK